MERATLMLTFTVFDNGHELVMEVAGLRISGGDAQVCRFWIAVSLILLAGWL
ncbi:hypothetical protein ACJJH9_07820 [Microbulbifer sp. DLAB2-AF]|uniref:hypothetical protein n=1 Tax=Microbulbifer sp. DLAB2-AF TaxID=3243395 RepID=UPI004039CD5B